ncbi:MAG: GNAT family N-acetyltransferase [Acidobacteriota bacterium]
MTVIETSRIWLQTWHPDDSSEFRYIATDPEVMRFIGNGQVWDDARIASWIAKQIVNYRTLGFSFWKLIEKSTNRLIGHSGIQYLANTGEIEIGWWLARRCWGQGFATEAASGVLDYSFENLKINRLVAIAYPENIASINIMKKIGMKFVRQTTGAELGLAYPEIQLVLYSIEKI